MRLKSGLNPGLSQIGTHRGTQTGTAKVPGPDPHQRKRFPGMDPTREQVGASNTHRGTSFRGRNRIQGTGAQVTRDTTMNTTRKSDHPLLVLADILVERTRSDRNRARGMAKDLPGRMDPVRPDPRFHEVCVVAARLNEIGEEIMKTIRVS